MSASNHNYNYPVKAPCSPKRIKAGGLIPLLLCLLATPALMQAQSPEILQVGQFSSAKLSEHLPDGWQPLRFSGIKAHTDYSLVEENDTVVIKAVSDQSASGLKRTISIDPAEYPIIQWRWKINNVLQKGDVSSKNGDDYPARIYITFALDSNKASYWQRLQHKAAQLIKGEDVPYRAITYIWGSNSSAGSMMANPYTDRVMMFVVEAGKKKSGQWVTESRNVYADYKKAFGEEPAMISGVAIMTDTDNTGESATTWYGDIVFMDKSARF